MMEPEKIISELEALLRTRTEELERLKSEQKKVALTYEDVPEHGDLPKLAAGHTPTLKKVEHLSTLKEETQPAIHLIEADNISSMLSLTATHANSVDIIYADPPYNTGKTFTYTDYRKSGWLSFMRRRLILARKLLKNEGTIFISINDAEQARLKMLMDEVFGEENFIANMVWRNSSKSGASKINLDHEYVLCYTKSIKEPHPKWKTGRHTDQIKEMYRIADTNRDNLEEAKQALSRYVKTLIKTDPDYGWLKNYSHIRIINNEPQIFYTVDLSVPGKPNQKTLKDGTILKPLPDRGWQSASKMDTLLDEDRISWKEGRPYQINPLEREHRTGVSSVLPKIYTRNGKEELKRMFGNRSPFDFPKPVELIKTLLSYTPNREAVVLDFFAGSGTTGQAVAELNHEDGGARECILLTNNADTSEDGETHEHRIAETVTAERLRKTLTGAGWTDNKRRAPLPGNLHYYRLELLPPNSEKLPQTLNDDLSPATVTALLTETRNELLNSGVFPLN